VSEGELGPAYSRREPACQHFDFARRRSAIRENKVKTCNLASLGETGLPYGDRPRIWIGRLSRRLKLDLTNRPCGRPRAIQKWEANSSDSFFT
jgi:hypothetical protein